ncbi:cytochrome c biogenesis protein ResB [Bordetella genomosp. 4]|uniref:Cytochrome C biogenesis protein ResB n=1 Tax=Bordetella genomosp. 4 TaxID=463044 RepID=A0A261V120_9BORD|nr:cytochrome c biogenesis protein ResB [Bordetella genomosp. 4]OZI41580.1 cytochrome C biogenesis protein ResB [Bordetella genomosp. 4]OZI67507.1 cytochrome C biogenesis protein ResB [Bordetella genomosp. 4]
MNSSTQPSRYPLRNLPRDVFELLGSMRFAVSLLMFICIASLLGTVLAQNRPSNTYIDQFGPFWFEVFDKFSIWHVYNSWWFLTIMGFLVVSTSVCLIRNTPKMLRDARSFREHVRASSLRAFPHRVEIHDAAAVDEAAGDVKGLLAQQGYAVRERRDGDGVMLAAKKGSANRLGYICAHSAMVIICIGGLLDSELGVRLQVMLAGKQPIVENMLISQVPASGRLSVANPSFRASVLIPEGGQASTAVVMVGDGALVQPLPFTLKLKKFLVDYYSTGMPSRFASEVEVTDPDTGKTFDSTIEVNEPLRYKGVTVYQSSFDDGGSTVKLKGYPLVGAGNTPFEVDGTVGKAAEITARSGDGSAREMQVDITALRPINVEDLSGGTPSGKPMTLGEHVASVSGSAAGKKNEHLRNVGPSVEYRLIDQAGQAHEFMNYMLPVELDGAAVFLAGVRNNASENYRYLRIPADADSSMAEFMQLRAALADPAARREAARRFAERNSPSPAEQSSLQTAAERALDTFSTGGLQAIAGFLQANTPQADLERAADVVIRLIGVSMAELRAVARERAGLPVLPETGPEAEQAAQWSRLAVAALSDLNVYPAPVFLTLSDFKQVQASVFQVSRTPGKNAVYIGCLLLVLGVFSMFYIRDRRVWVWIKPAADGAGSDVHAAMTSQKRTLDFNQEFERFKQALLRRNRP